MIYVNYYFLKIVSGKLTCVLIINYYCDKNNDDDKSHQSYPNYPKPVIFQSHHRKLIHIYLLAFIYKKSHCFYSNKIKMLMKIFYIYKYLITKYIFTIL